MKKLSKDELEIQKQLLESFAEKASDVDRLYSEYVDAVAALNAAIDDLNGTVTELENYRQSIFDQMEEYFDGKSEKWQESDTGTEYRDWMDEWSNATVDTMEDVEEVGIDIPDVSLFDELRTEFDN